MMIAYLFICLSSVLFSCQFLFQQKYTKLEGTSVNGALRFSFAGALVQIPFLLTTSFAATHTNVAFLHSVSGPLTGFTLPAAGIALLSAVNAFLNTYFAVKVFACADMTLFSIFEMLGGMTLPFVAGLLLFGEPMTWGKGIGFLLITLSLVLETGKASRVTSKALFYYIGLFITNGMSGVLAKWNQSIEAGASSNAFILMGSVFGWILCASLLFGQRIVKKTDIRFSNTQKAIKAIIPYMIVSTMGSMFLLAALETLPASVQYPISTGGTIAVSVLISMLRHDELHARNYIAAVLAVGSAVVVAL